MTFVPTLAVASMLFRDEGHALQPDRILATMVGWSLVIGFGFAAAAVPRPGRPFTRLWELLFWMFRRDS